MNALDRYFEASEPSDEEKEGIRHMTWQELLNEGENDYRKKVYRRQKLNAWYLFSDCFETSKSDFFLNQELRLKVRKTERFLALIAKRCERIPLEYLLGETEFMGLPFFGQ